MPITNHDLESQRKKNIGRWLLPLSIFLFCLQFILLARGNVLPTGNTVASYAVNLGPFVLMLTSLHLLFGKKKIPREPFLLRLLVVLLASYSAGGGVLLILLTFGLGIVGNSAGNLLFDNFGLLLILLTFLTFPIVNKYLH